MDRTHPLILKAVREVRKKTRERLEQQQQQQQQQPRSHPAAAAAGGGGGPRSLHLHNVSNVDHHSAQHLVNFLNGEGYSQHGITQLWLSRVTLVDEPSEDGALDVLRDFIATNTTLTEIIITDECNFGSTEEASRLVAAFESNTSVTCLGIGGHSGIVNLQGAALGRCLSRILQRNTHIQKLTYLRGLETLRALVSGLRVNSTLKELDFSHCAFGDEGIRLLADSLIENTCLDILNLRRNNITSAGLVHITRLLENTQLKVLVMSFNLPDIFNVHTTTERFAHILSQNQFLTTLDIVNMTSNRAAQELLQALESNSKLEILHLGPIGNDQQGADLIIASIPRMKGLKKLILNHRTWMECLKQHATLIRALHQNTSLESLPSTHFLARTPTNQALCASCITVDNILARNRRLRRANELLALQGGRTPGRPLASKSGIWYRAMEKLACGSNHPDGTIQYAGASAIFKIFQARPALLEKQLLPPPPPPPPPAVAASAASSRPEERQSSSVQQEQDRTSDHDDDDGDDGSSSITDNAVRVTRASSQRKRQRRR